MERNSWVYKKETPRESLLLYLSEVWKTAINGGKTFGMIFIEYSKACNSIDQQILEQRQQ